MCMHTAHINDRKNDVSVTFVIDFEIIEIFTTLMDWDFSIVGLDMVCMDWWNGHSCCLCQG